MNPSGSLSLKPRAAADGPERRAVECAAEYPPRPLAILLVSPYPVFPALSGGKTRIVEIAGGLARIGHRVTVLTPWHPRQALAPRTHSNFRLQQMPYPFLLPLLLTDRPFPFLYLASFHPGLGPALTSTFRDYDVVQFEHVPFAEMICRVADTAVIGYDAHNVEFDYVRDECVSRPVRDAVGRRMHRLEGMLARASSCVFPVSLGDQERLSALYGVRPEACTVSPNGISFVKPASQDDSAALHRFPGIARHRRRAIFSGSDVEHNRRAVDHLLREVAPRAPDTAFVIHGRCGSRFQRTCSLGNVFFDERHSQESFGEHAVFGMIGLNPVETGGGTNLKVLNYLSHGLSVLSTDFGMRGYDDLRDFVRVADRERFAAILQDGEYPAPPPPALLWDRYSWNAIAARMSRAYLAHFTGSSALAEA